MECEHKEFEIISNKPFKAKCRNCGIELGLKEVRKVIEEVRKVIEDSIVKKN